jgi:hypothetical protein
LDVTGNPDHPYPVISHMHAIAAKILELSRGDEVIERYLSCWYSDPESCGNLSTYPHDLDVKGFIVGRTCGELFDFNIGFPFTPIRYRGLERNGSVNSGLVIIDPGGFSITVSTEDGAYLAGLRTFSQPGEMFSLGIYSVPQLASFSYYSDYNDPSDLYGSMTSGTLEFISCQISDRIPLAGYASNEPWSGHIEGRLTGEFLLKDGASFVTRNVQEGRFVLPFVTNHCESDPPRCAYLDSICFGGRQRVP